VQFTCGAWSTLTRVRTETDTALLAYDMRETVGRLVRRLRREPGPPLGQHAVLGRLDRDGPASISELAAESHMRPQSMAQTVKDLEEAGHIRRRADPADGRRWFVELTTSGRQVLEKTRAQREDWLTRALDSELDESERERLRDALRLLARVADA
jgi:DNA-binding MarR family transcriptional regulator